MKKFKKAILHVGPDKTGSTSIQRACDTGRDLLIKHGVFYPAGLWHAELGSCFCDAPEKYIFNIQSGFNDREKIQESNRIYLSQFRKELEQNISEILVLSYEGFVYLNEESLIHFRDFIAEYATTYEVVFYARSPLSYATSGMSQRVKSGLLSWPNGVPPVMPSQVVLKMLCKVFGKENLNVRKFAREALPNGDVVPDFLSLLNLPDAVLNVVSSFAVGENQALSREGLLIGERIIKLLGNTVPAEGEFYHRFDKILSGIKGEKIRLNAVQLSEIKHASKEHSNYLSKNFGISFAAENYEVDESSACIPLQTVDSLAKLLLELALPEVNAPTIQTSKEINSPDLTLVSATMREDKTVVRGQLITFDIDFILNREIGELEAGIHIFDEQKRWAFGINSSLLGQTHQLLPGGSYRVSHHLAADLPAGKYTAGFAFAELLPEGEKRELAWRDVMCEFQVHHPAGKTFAGYAYLPAEISISPTRLALDEMVVKSPIGSLVALTPVSSMIADSQNNIKVAITNLSEQLWLGDSLRPVKLSYHWLKSSDEVLINDGVRSDLPMIGIPASLTMDAEMLVIAPPDAGTFILVLTLVQELVGWFENNGFVPARLTIEITAPHE